MRQNWLMLHNFHQVSEIASHLFNMLRQQSSDKKKYIYKMINSTLCVLASFYVQYSLYIVYLYEVFCLLRLY